VEKDFHYLPKLSGNMQQGAVERMRRMQAAMILIGLPGIWITAVTKPTRSARKQQVVFVSKI